MQSHKTARDAWDDFYSRHGHLPAATRLRPGSDGWYQSAYAILDQIESVARFTLKGETALEVGCGTGRLLRVLCTRFEKVYGTDISEVALSICENETVHLSNLELHLGGTEVLERMESESIDFVLSVATFQHVASDSEVDRYVTEIARLLKCGGIAILDFANPTLIRKLHDLLTDSARWSAQLLKIAKDGTKLGLPAFHPFWRGSRRSIENLAPFTSETENFTLEYSHTRMSSWLVLKKVKTEL